MTDNEPIERPDLEALGFSPEQAQRWNQIADKLIGLNSYNGRKWVLTSGKWHQDCHPDAPKANDPENARRMRSKRCRHWL